MNARQHEAFTAYVEARDLPLMRTASLISGHRGGAAALLTRALVRLRLAWPRVGDTDGADAFMRRQFAESRGEPGASGVPTDPLWSALLTLPSRARAAVVFHAFDGVPEGDIAAALGCSPPAGRRVLSSALSGLPGNGKPEFAERLAAVLRAHADEVAPLAMPVATINAKAGVLHRRRAVLAGAGAAVLLIAGAVAVPLLVKNTSPAVAFVAGAPASSTSPSGAAPRASVAAPIPLGAAVAVYYVGDAASGPKLYREFRRTIAIDRVRGAIDFMLAPPLDPDYRTPWPAGTRVRSVVVTGGVAVVDLSAAAADVVTGSCAYLQQLVWTVTAADTSIVGLKLRVDGKEQRGDLSPGAASCYRNVPTTRHLPAEFLAPIQISTFNHGDPVARRFSFGGEVTADADSQSLTIPDVMWSVTGPDGRQLAAGKSPATAKSGARGRWQAIVVLQGVRRGDVVTLRAWDAAGGAVRNLDTKTVRIAG